MAYDCDVLPGGGSSRSPPKSPSQIAGQVVLGLRRPSRLRARIVAVILGVSAVFLFMLGNRRGVAYREYVATIKGFNPISGFDTTRWRDQVNDDNLPLPLEKKPKFHLLIPVSDDPSIKVCRTILSAAVLNYPPPTLINYNATSEEEDDPALVATKGIMKFMEGRETRDDDLALVVGDDTWLQLPAEIMVRRYVKHLLEADLRLLKIYGTKGNNETKETETLDGLKEAIQNQNYIERVVFGAQKACVDHAPGDLACEAVPSSSLADSVYGQKTDQLVETTRPRFLNGQIAIGRIADLRPIWKATIAKQEKKKAINKSQWAFSQVFGEQEAQREFGHKETMTQKAETWSTWWARKFSANRQKNANVAYENFTALEGQNYQFSIGLDYESSLFQTIANSKNDIHFVTFDHPIMVHSPSSPSSSSQQPLQLPNELNNTDTGPFVQHVEAPDSPSTSNKRYEIDELPTEKQWADISLAANVIVPGGVIPTALSFGDNSNAMEGWWRKMWFQPFARALLRRYIRSPQGVIAAKAAAEGGEQWWDLRGGKGGVWTDRGEWLEWNEVCGEFHEEIFGDGKGVFGKEVEEESAPEYNKFGKLIAGEGPAELPKEDEEQKKAEEEEEKKKAEEEEGKKKAEKEEEETQKAKEEEERKKEEEKVNMERKKDSESQKEGGNEHSADEKKAGEQR